MARNKNHTGWAGALAVAAELSRRGYDAAITLGNTPVLDIICSSPGEKLFHGAGEDRIKPHMGSRPKTALGRSAKWRPLFRGGVDSSG